MDETKLARIRDDIAAARRKPQTQGDLAGLASRLGRTHRKGGKGKHQTWVTSLPGCYPLSIPAGKRRDLKPGTKKSVLDQLEGDVEAWEMMLQEQANGA
ncbi:hypothetical protein LZ518_01835 [Sphingomonas sp. RB56-2]|uniref:Uncharacterized protein n=1 Tax=Sphingomonas brevis TaxID=2908206 RepID=A0ABT0S6V5_9SPHN|nr:hypothetical protein [Sphingomonas brevis]MCL6739880.1 hypothetical protein [Sphingomonas brevis]